jgi:parallel beta-helix repeat protein
MKRIVSLLVLVLLFIPARPVFAGGGGGATVVTITADQVDGANDIEAAIYTATGWGSHPGTVVLDGSKGPFLLTDLDKSLNIMVSDITLRGINQARIEACDDGLFFDDVPIHDILVENIAFFCTGDGVDGYSSIQDVIIRDNLFLAGASGVNQDGAPRGWLITGNTFIAEGPGMVIQNGEGFVITGNHISSGAIGIHLAGDSNFQVRGNVIRAGYQGVLLYQEAWRNKVQSNTILGVTQSGIALEPGVTNNQVLANRVTCAEGSACLTVDALPEVMENNTVAGNKP